MKPTMHGLCRICLICLAICLFHSSANTQDEYQKWLEQQNQEYEQYMSEQDKAFGEFLEQQWVGMQVLAGIKRETTPKPIQPPVAQKPLMPPPAPPVPDLKIIAPIEIPIPKPAPIPAPQSPPPPVKEPQKYETLTVAVFGEPLEFLMPRNMRVKLGYPINNESIASFWKGMSGTNHESLLAQLKQVRERLALNDWGYGKMLNEVGKAIFAGSPNQVNLFIWFMLLKSGYGAKVGYSGDEVLLLLPFSSGVYDVSYFTLEGKRYYLISFDKEPKEPGQVFTYKGDYPEASQPVNLKIDRAPTFKSDLVSRSLKFAYAGKEYNLEARYNKNTVAFMQNYPTTDLALYFAAAMTADAGYALLSALKPIIEGKSEVEAVNILLCFVQTAFNYENDEQQFGKEKYMFHEETLYYKACDCEDRAILFSYLVKNLVGLDVIGLDWPGHVATAVRFGVDIPGDFVTLRGIKYLICDPTYIDASAGMCMEQFRNVNPKIMPLAISNF